MSTTAATEQTSTMATAPASTANSTTYSMTDSTEYPNTTTIDMTSITTTTNIISTTSDDPNYTLAYIAVSASVLAMTELVIIIVLIIRCYRATGKQDDHVKLNEEYNEDGLENQLFAVVNRAYTGFIPNEENKAKDRTQRPISQTKKSNDAVINETKKPQRRDPGYIDIDIMIDTPTDAEEFSRRTKPNETGFINKTYSHIERKSQFLPRTDRSTYSHIKHKDDERGCNRETTNSNIPQGIKHNTDTDDDPEYDHAVNRRSYQTFGDNKTYSRLSSVVPRQNPFFGVIEEDIDITDKRHGDTQVSNTEEVAIGTSNESCKEGTERDLNLTKGQSCTSDVKRKRQYNYSKVIKVNKSERNQPKPETEHACKRKEETDDKSISLKSEDRYKKQSQKSDKPFAAETLDCTSDLKPNQQYKYSKVKKRSQGVINEPKSGIEHTKTVAAQQEKEDTPIRKKTDRRYEYSQVIKKTANTATDSVHRERAHHDPDNKMSFIVADDEDSGNQKINKRHEYINIVRPSSI